MVPNLIDGNCVETITIDNAKVRATTLERPEKIWVCVDVHAYNATVRKSNLVYN